MKVSKRILFYEISDELILMISTLTGAVDIINKQVYRSLIEYASRGMLELDEAVISSLKRRGYLFDDDLSEQSLLNPIVNAYAKMKKRMSFIICPTYNCNLRCTYCFEGDLTQNDRSFTQDDVERLFAAIDELRQIYDNRRASIELFGGEPLLPKTKPFVKKVLAETRRRSLPLVIVTNGIHVNHFIDELQACRDLLGPVQITLDGPKIMHDVRRKFANDKGTFDKVCSAIDMLLNMQIRVMARVNIDLQNIDSIPELFDYMVTRGWVDNQYFSCNLSPVQDHTFKKGYEYLASEDKLVEKIFEMFRKHPRLESVFVLNMFRNLRHIMAVLSSKQPVQPLLHYCESNNLENLVFGPDGYIYPCTECIGNRELAIGQFRPALEMYEATVNMWNNRNIFTIDKCKQCDIALLCGGGCAYSALTVNGDINKPVCNNARETIFAYLEYVRDDLANKVEA